MQSDDEIVVGGKYKLIECIGEGAFGEIFSGKHPV